MLILDFSTQTLDKLLCTETHTDWQREIMNFVKDFSSNESCIKVYSSGSTGKPKIFSFRKELFRKSAEITGQFLHLEKGNTALLCLPVQYIAGKMMIVRAITLQLKLFCVKPSLTITLHEDFDFSAMTPMQAENSLEFLPNVKNLLIGGMPIGHELCKKLTEKNTAIYETFGMTETLSHIALKALHEKSTTFKTLPDIKISATKENCLVIDSAFSEKPLITHDIVKLVSEHEFIWLGRLDNVINTGGIKVQAEVVEEKLRDFIQFPFYISSKNNSKSGEEVVLVVENTHKNSEDILHNIQLIKEISKWEMPKSVLYETKFERTKSGKIIRKKFS